METPDISRSSKNGNNTACVSIFPFLMTIVEALAKVIGFVKVALLSMMALGYVRFELFHVFFRSLIFS